MGMAHLNAGKKIMKAAASITLVDTFLPFAIHIMLSSVYICHIMCMIYEVSLWSGGSRNNQTSACTFWPDNEVSWSKKETDSSHAPYEKGWNERRQQKTFVSMRRKASTSCWNMTWLIIIIAPLLKMCPIIISHLECVIAIWSDAERW